MGSYCSTSESEEGKLWPLPCFLASLFHYFWAPSLKSLLVFNICLLFFPHTLLFRFRRYPPFACALISCSLPPLCKSDFLSLSFALSLSSCCLVLPPPWLSPHHASVIPTLPPFLSPDCMYPSIRVWIATSDLAGHILCASICWLDLQFHFINIVILFTIVFPLCLRLFLSRPSSFVITSVCPWILLLS